MKTANEVRRLAEKGVSFLYLIGKALLPQRKVRENSSVLFVWDGGIGDAIMDASAWETLIRYYSDKGKTIYFYTPKASWNVFNKIIDTGRAVFIENKYTGKTLSISARKMLAPLKQMKFDTIIGRYHGNPWLSFGVAVTNARNRYAVLEQELCDGAFGACRKLLFRRYTNPVIETIDMNECESTEALLHGLGLTDYRMHLMPIPKQCEIGIAARAYITIAVDSHNKSRRWGAEKFIELTGALLKTCSEDIYLTGDAVSDGETARYANSFRDEPRVKNVVGKLSFNEWIELIRGADYHIGVDSGSIHIAASVGTTAFCLAGVWSGYRFFPYSMKEYLPGTVAPICVYRKDVAVDSLPCFGCATKWGECGRGDRECLKRCRAELPRLCLEKITVDDVMSAIEKAKLDGVV